MKKNTIKAFTLVEMLIVIVIIGILIAALMPRMQAAQWRARDVSRKTALSQVQSAIVVSQWDKWAWPGMEGNNGNATTNDARQWIALKAIKSQLESAWMNGVPEDPLSSRFAWLWTLPEDDSEDGQYRYMVLPRNWTADGWFVLMAKTEVEWWSNRIYCGTETNGNDPKERLKKWVIKVSTDSDDKVLISASTDIMDIKPCVSLSKCSDEGCCGRDAYNSSECKYEKDEQLRYIVTY